MNQEEMKECCDSVNIKNRRRYCVRQTLNLLTPKCAAAVTLMGVVSSAAFTYAAPVVLTKLGFATAGIGAGSWAAWYQATYGTTSLFTLLQSAGMAGVGLSSKTLASVLGATTLAALGVCLESVEVPMD